MDPIATCVMYDLSTETVIVTAQDASENTENDQRDNDAKLFIEFGVRMKRFLLKLHL